MQFYEKSLNMTSKKEQKVKGMEENAFDEVSDEVDLKEIEGVFEGLDSDEL